MSTSAGMNRFSDCAWSMKGVRSAASSISQRWSISKLVLNVSFSSTREEVEMLDRAALLEDRIPHRGRILGLVLKQCLEVRVLDREAARQRLVGVDVGRDRLDAGRGAAGDDRDRRGRRDRHLAAEKRSITPMSAASGQGPRSLASIIDASSTWARICLKILRFQLLAIAPSNGSPRACRKLWKPITPRPTDRSRSALYLARAISSGARAI